MTWKMLATVALAAFVGTGLFVASYTFYQDWAFLHAARVATEAQRQQQPQAAPRPPDPQKAPEAAK